MERGGSISKLTAILVHQYRSWIKLDPDESSQEPAHLRYADDNEQHSISVLTYQGRVLVSFVWQ